MEFAILWTKNVKHSDSVLHIYWKCETSDTHLHSHALMLMLMLKFGSDLSVFQCLLDQKSEYSSKERKFQDQFDPISAHHLCDLINSFSIYDWHLHSIQINIHEMCSI